MPTLKEIFKNLNPEIPGIELDSIVSNFQTKKVSKGGILTPSGALCRHLALVKHGCFKIFSFESCGPVNAWFAFEGMPATEMQSFISEKPSNFQIEATEDSEVFVIAKSDLQLLYSQYPSFMKAGMRLTEIILLHLIDRLHSLQVEAPSERLDKLDKRYLRRVKQKDIASFLGVTPNSLSRIRRRR